LDTFGIPKETVTTTPHSRCFLKTSFMVTSDTGASYLLSADD
jgi:hypothetical protein